MGRRLSPSYPIAYSMGNHESLPGRETRWSRKKSSRNNTSPSQRQAEDLKQVEDLQVPAADSYDKLVAWLAGMAENDKVHLDTSVFVKQLSNVRGGDNPIKAGTSGSAVHSLRKMASSGSERGTSGTCVGFGGSRRHLALLHNSASCDSRPGASIDCRYNAGRSSRSLDDAAGPRHLTWRHQHQLSSRQGTCSDDLEEDSDVRNASMESLYSSSDRDSELESMASTYCEPTACRRPRLAHLRDQRTLRRPLLRQALLGSSLWSSMGDWDVGMGSRDSQDRSSGHCDDSSCSLRNSLNSRSATLPPEIVPWSSSMGDLDKLNTGIEDMVGKSTPVKIFSRRRSVSLLNLTPPGRAAYYVPDVAPPDNSPVKAPSSEMFLDDSLLDSNLADILFSVEALWPRK